MLCQQICIINRSGLRVPYPIKLLKDTQIEINCLGYQNEQISTNLVHQDLRFLQVVPVFLQCLAFPPYPGILRDLHRLCRLPLWILENLVLQFFLEYQGWLNKIKGCINVLFRHCFLSGQCLIQSLLPHRLIRYHPSSVLKLNYISQDDKGFVG